MVETNPLSFLPNEGSKGLSLAEQGHETSKSCGELSPLALIEIGSEIKTENTIIHDLISESGTSGDDVNAISVSD